MFRIAFASLVTASFASAPAAAESYLQIHGGLFQQNDESIEFDGGQIADEISEISADADMGYALGGLIGTYFFPFLALEGEFTARTNEFDEVTIDNLGTAFDDDIRTYAFMANAVFRPELKLPLLPNPYAGVGIGYVTTNLEDLDGDDVDGAFAWQVKAGITFDPLPTPGKIGLELNYIQTGDFEIDGRPEVDIPDAEFAYSGFTGLVTWKLGF
ncbi:MAG: outer membrane beta-barrel protein [Parvularcula sp.]|jgi:opacity protein-like surface antigen|nr:outer membrane beta-barrel protein [Parvularcula sp.]